MAERRLAVLIGSSIFSEDESDLQNLRCPPNDVKGLANVLLDPERGGFSSVDKLINCPWYEVLRYINKVLQEATYEDLVLLYYSGHGKLNRLGRLYLATPETTISNLEATSIPIETIRTFIDGTLAERVVLILDCCYSGRVGDAWLRRSSISDGLKTTFEEGEGIYILTASTGIETALEKEGEDYSVFTKPLIEGIQTANADSGHDGQISMEELYQYISEEVAKVSTQTPLRWNLSGRGDIVIARSAGGHRPDFAIKALLQKRPASLSDFSLPRMGKYFPSPSDWRDEIFYLIIPDRFSDGLEPSRPILDRGNRNAARPEIGGKPWDWDLWSHSGESRWQGGTLSGVKSKLPYLEKLGISTLWIWPVFKQPIYLASYHGDAVQDFLDVDPRLGTRSDLVDLVAAAHAKGMRVILSIVISHSGPNWIYPDNARTPPFVPGRYPFGAWLDQMGNPIEHILNDDDGVWPIELQAPDCYTRAGVGNLNIGDINNPHEEALRSDFLDYRRFDLTKVIGILMQIYRYWIALTDCDGFHLDLLELISFEMTRSFCIAIKEYAKSLGKDDFFLLGQITAREDWRRQYFDVLARSLNANLNAVLDDSFALQHVAKGLASSRQYFDGFESVGEGMQLHRSFGSKHVSLLDGPHNVYGRGLRFSNESASPHQVVAGVALQLFTLGIPSIYYGTEQALAGPEPAQRFWLSQWKVSYLREAMFGPEHPRLQGRNGLLPPPVGLDFNLPGFGPFGTAGHHCFDESTLTFQKIAALIETRRKFRALRSGRQYARPTSILGMPFEFSGPGELVAWARIMGDVEVLCIFNSHGVASRGADVVVSNDLNREGSWMMVVLNTAQVGIPELANYSGSHPLGSRVQVRYHSSGAAYVEIRDIQPSEVLVLSNLS